MERAPAAVNPATIGTSTALSSVDSFLEDDGMVGMERQEVGRAKRARGVALALAS
jgi:hypothetical protein